MLHRKVSRFMFKSIRIHSETWMRPHRCEWGWKMRLVGGESERERVYGEIQNVRDGEERVERERESVKDRWAGWSDKCREKERLAGLKRYGWDVGCITCLSTVVTSVSLFRCTIWSYALTSPHSSGQIRLSTHVHTLLLSNLIPWHLLAMSPW